MILNGVLVSPDGVNIADVWLFCPCARTVVHHKHPTGLCEHCGEEESVEHVICVCQKLLMNEK